MAHAEKYVGGTIFCFEILPVQKPKLYRIIFRGNIICTKYGGRLYMPPILQSQCGSVPPESS